MTEPIRVLHVLGSSKFGGATGVVFSLVDMAREHGLEVDVLTDDPATIEACKDRGVGVFHFRGIDRPLRPHKDLWAALRLARAIRGRYQLVHTHTTKGGAVGRVAARWAGIPIVIHTVHGFAFHEFSSKWMTRIGVAAERSLARCCEKIIFVNNFDREFAIELGIGRDSQLVTVYNGVPADRLEPGRTVDRSELLCELGVPEEACLCVFVGRLAPQKGLDHLLKAMAIVRDRLSHPRVHLAVVGEGELGAQLRQQVQCLGLNNCTHMLGFRTDAVRWTGGCDVFVLASLWEGHSITLLEAMGLGRPIVATDIKGNRESIVHDQDGLLAPAADASALADGIIALATNRGRACRLGSAAQRSFEERFTEKGMKQNTWELYESLLRHRGLL